MKELKINPPEGYIIDEEKSTIYNIVFKKKNELPATWEEFCKNYPRQVKEGYIETNSYVSTITKTGNDRSINTDKNLLPSKEVAEAHLALMQLHRLRDVYRQGWIPDWKTYLQSKYIVVHEFNDFDILEVHTTNTFLAFQSKEIAKQFLENFKDLINTAKELI